ncbi:helix-turn-helix transcriptional regulator [Candidatus Poriferisodalis sp.]|uniref:helix-turn-helix transcriptional regulator n=1 Tax=Candidatus Poriferisodalis sp. TaxID=3101277 RepID=UPI003B5A6876
MEARAALAVRSAGSLASVIAARRALSGFTQQALADAAGVSRKLVCDAEAGKLTVQLDGLIKICVALGCDVVVREADRTRLGYQDALASLE